jgi:mycofactocin system transcriptional regulator
MRLFARRGFDATTVEEIAAAAGISRRSFFRYYESKNDVVWGRFDEGLEQLRQRLAEAPTSVPLSRSLRHAIVEFNELPPRQMSLHRQRMALILGVSSLQAHSTLMFARWREVVAEFVAERTGSRPDALGPRLAGYLLLGAAVAAYEQWLAEKDASLRTLLDDAVAMAAVTVDRLAGDGHGIVAR